MTRYPGNSGSNSALLKNMILVPLSAIGLVACGGGGGSSSGPATIPPAPEKPNPPADPEPGDPAPTDPDPADDLSGHFTFPATTHEAMVAVDEDGDAQFSSADHTAGGTGTFDVTLDKDGTITNLKITGEESSITFDFSEGNDNQIIALIPTEGLDNANTVMASADRKAVLVIPSPDMGLEYQTFGIWGTNIIPDSIASFGAYSVPTTQTAPVVPTSGSATFSGHALGLYADNKMYGYVADASFDVDFSGRSVAFSTSNERLSELNSTTSHRVAGLSISGTMAYGAGSANFSGNLTATGIVTPAGGGSPADLTGTGYGTFYGPDANELGGTFFLQSAAEGLIGGFGARR